MASRSRVAYAWRLREAGDCLILIFCIQHPSTQSFGSSINGTSNLPTNMPTSSSTAKLPAPCASKDALPQAPGDSAATGHAAANDSAATGHAAAASFACPATLLALPPEVLSHILQNLNASSALAFGLTSKASLPFFDDDRHFQAAMRRDFPEAAAAATAAVDTETNSGNAKKQYYLQLSIMCGYDPRWYRLSASGGDVVKSRQGFGKTVLLGHPVVFGGWATDSRGFFDIERDVVYLSDQSAAMSTAQYSYQWKRLRIANTESMPRFATYCTVATGVDDVPLSQLINIDGFADLARAREWNTEDDATFPVLFVSGGVAEGAYRCATSYLFAVIGGEKRRSKTERERKDTCNNSDKMAVYDWCWLSVCRGVFGEIPASQRSLAAAREAVSDAIPTGASSNGATLSSSPTSFGGSSRAGHTLLYDKRLGCIVAFGGFCDTIARRSWVEGGLFDEGSDRIGNPAGNLPQLGWSGHRALHHLEVYDLSKGRWARVLQLGANPIARFGCSIIDVTEEKPETGSNYLVMGGCTGRNNHKGMHADGTELQDPASHRILQLQRSNSTDSHEEFVARWRIPLDSERANLTVDSTHCQAALGRLHSSCKIAEHSDIFFGGGRPGCLSSSLMSLKSGIADPYAKKGSPRFVNWGRPLSSYHTTSGNVVMEPEDFDYHYSRRIGSNADNSRLVPSPSLPRGDCMLVVDPHRSGEAFLYGGWRGDELGDCFKLVLGIERSDERERYGNRAESIRRTRGASEGS